MADFSIKRGATLLLGLMLTDDNGVPVDLTKVTLTAQLRDATGLLIEQLAITLSAFTGVATIRSDNTLAWPVSRAIGDVKAVMNGITLISDTFAIRVARETTQ